MFGEELVEAFNNRLASITDLKSMTPGQLDRVKALGTAAENLLKNKDFVLFVRQFQLESVDSLTGLKSHNAEDDATRIAISNQLSGIDSFIDLLKRQVYLKNRVVTQQTEPNT
jgi:hypothetical protein